MLFLEETKPVVFDLDDFCEEIMTEVLWGLLFGLKQRHPKLKVTLFTIPLKCSERWLREHKLDWMELHYHGSDHEDRDEWMGKTQIDFPYEGLFYKGFKAPWFRMDQITADALSSQGYMISTRRGKFDVNAKRVYRYNEGKPIIEDVWYEQEKFHAIHSHVQHQKRGDGLPDIIDKIVFPKNADFLFVSEV